MQKGTRDSIKTTIHKRDALRPSSDTAPGKKNVVLALNQNQIQNFKPSNRPSAKGFDV